MESLTGCQRMLDKEGDLRCQFEYLIESLMGCKIGAKLGRSDGIIDGMSDEYP